VRYQAALRSVILEGQDVSRIFSAEVQEAKQRF
jgi:hypothetical protein